MQRAAFVPRPPKPTGESLWVDGKMLAGGMTAHSAAVGTWSRDPTDYPEAVPVGASLATSSATAVLFGQAFPVDRVKYEVSAWVKGATTFYIGIALIDSAGTAIQPRDSIEGRFPGSTLTTLAAPLNPGNTTVTLTDATGWATAANTVAEREVLFWPYTDGAGKVWADYTYSRVRAPFDSRSGNVITLSAPWAGAALPAGSAAMNTQNGGTFIYATAQQATSQWARYSGVIDLSTTTFPLGWRTGSVQARPVILANYVQAAVNQKFADLTIRRI